MIIRSRNIFLLFVALGWDLPSDPGLFAGHCRQAGLLPSNSFQLLNPTQLKLSRGNHLKNHLNFICRGSYDNTGECSVYLELDNREKIKGEELVVKSFIR